jgi:hypothetical protein
VKQRRVALKARRKWLLYCREQYRQIDLTPSRLARYLSGLGGSQNPPRLQRWTAMGTFPWALSLASASRLLHRRSQRPRRLFKQKLAKEAKVQFWLLNSKFRIQPPNDLSSARHRLCASPAATLARKLKPFRVVLLVLLKT